MLLCSSWAGHSPPLWTHLLIHSSPDIFVFFLSLQYASFVLSLGPLHLQFPLSGKFFYQILAWLSPCHSDLRSVWSHRGIPDCPILCDCITDRTHGHCLVNLRIYWLIVCFLPWHMSCKRTGITAPAHSLLYPQGWASPWQMFAEEMKQSWLSQLSPVWPWASQSIFIMLH